tara:strand:+ start:1482 stop:1652 length:171 start_codon:yes stop_codon:yes gene_type:complete
METFWEHKCPVLKRLVYIPVGKKCPDCGIRKISGKFETKRIKSRTTNRTSARNKFR